MKYKIKTRFAPSPSGGLHLGGARTALYNWIYAKKNKGSFYLRFEDTDKTRTSKESMHLITEAMQWLGLDFEEQVLLQSERKDTYQIYYDNLLQQKYAYYCNCSNERLTNLRENQIKAKINPHYDGHCRDKNIKLGRDTVMRLNTIALINEGNISFVDSLRGNISQPIDHISDFIIRRSNQDPIYHFVVVIDDIYQEITHVIRGDDHTINTIRQLLIYKALNQTPPQYTHLPLLHGVNGKALSKRDAAADTLHYKKLGFLPEAMVNYLLRLGWSHKNIEYITTEAAIELFTLKDLNSSASKIDEKKLAWLNKQHMKNMSSTTLHQMMAKNYSNRNSIDGVAIVEFYKNRCTTLTELQNQVDKYYKDPCLDKKILREIIGSKDEIQLVNFYNELVKYLNDIQQWELDTIKIVLNDCLHQYGYELKDIGLMLRYLLLGEKNAPSINFIIFSLGKNNTIKRIKSFIDS